LLGAGLLGLDLGVADLGALSGKLLAQRRHAAVASASANRASRRLGSSSSSASPAATRWLSARRMAATWP
jgi:hypothetical protein